MTQDRTQTLLNRGCGRAVLQRGFNIIELMVVLAIIGMVLMYGVPTMGAWMQSSQIRNAAESIQSGLQLARNEAVSRNTNVQFVLSSVAGGGVASDWSVNCVTPSATCPGAGMTQTEIQKRIAAEGSANVQVAAPQTTFVFNGMGRITPALAAAGVSIDITNPLGGTCAALGGAMRCLKIVATPGGQTRMCDPALNLATNPRGCN